MIARVSGSSGERSGAEGRPWSLENVIEGLVTVKGMPVSEAAARGRALLEKVGLADKMETYP